MRSGSDDIRGPVPRDGDPEDGSQSLDARSAADIMRDADLRARRELTVNTPALLGIWGLMYLLGYGVIWLGVRGQHPYQGPPGWSLGVLTLLVITTLIALIAIMNSAARGVGGTSARRRRIELAAVAAGLIAVFAVEGGVRSAGGSIGATDLIGASGPIGVYGLVLAGFGSAWRQRHDIGLGLWFIAIAVGSAFAGAATMWGVDGLAAALGCLAVAAARFRHSEKPGASGMPGLGGQPVRDGTARS